MLPAFEVEANCQLVTGTQAGSVRYHGRQTGLVRYYGTQAGSVRYDKP
jgi:hypothetical protein